MTIRKKISSKKDVIERGGRVLADLENDQYTNICVRMKKGFLQKLDELIKERIGISRNTWILEAIQEKIKKTEAAND